MDLGHKGNTIQSLGSINVPKEYYDRIYSGAYSVDYMFGGDITPGLVKGSTVALTGSPGGGKSTLLTQLCHMFSGREGLRVLYNSNEEASYAIKMRADRLGLTFNNDNFLVGSFNDVEKLMYECYNNNVDILVQDSLPTLTIEGKEDIKKVCERIVGQTSDLKLLTFVICHVTKAGKMSGPKTIEHAVDVYCHMEPNKNKNRVIEVKKNRMGPSLKKFEFCMTEHGFNFDPISIK